MRKPNRFLKNMHQFNSLGYKKSLDNSFIYGKQIRSNQYFSVHEGIRQNQLIDDQTKQQSSDNFKLDLKKQCLIKLVGLVSPQKNLFQYFQMLSLCFDQIKDLKEKINEINLKNKHQAPEQKLNLDSTQGNAKVQTSKAEKIKVQEKQIQANKVQTQIHKAQTHKFQANKGALEFSLELLYFIQKCFNQFYKQNQSVKIQTLKLLHPFYQLDDQITKKTPQFIIAVQLQNALEITEDFQIQKGLLKQKFLLYKIYLFHGLKPKQTKQMQKQFKQLSKEEFNYLYQFQQHLKQYTLQSQYVKRKIESQLIQKFNLYGEKIIGDCYITDQNKRQYALRHKAIEFKGNCQWIIQFFIQNLQNYSFQFLDHKKKLIQRIEYNNMHPNIQKEIGLKIYFELIQPSEQSDQNIKNDGSKQTQTKRDLNKAKNQDILNDSIQLITCQYGIRDSSICQNQTIFLYQLMQKNFNTIRSNIISHKEKEKMTQQNLQNSTVAAEIDSDIKAVNKERKIIQNSYNLSQLAQNLVQIMHEYFKFFDQFEEINLKNKKYLLPFSVKTLIFYHFEERFQLDKLQILKMVFDLQKNPTTLLNSIVFQKKQPFHLRYRILDILRQIFEKIKNENIFEINVLNIISILIVLLQVSGKIDKISEFSQYLIKQAEIIKQLHSKDKTSSDKSEFMKNKNKNKQESNNLAKNKEIKLKQGILIFIKQFSALLNSKNSLNSLNSKCFEQMINSAKYVQLSEQMRAIIEALLKKDFVNSVTNKLGNSQFTLNPKNSSNDPKDSNKYVSKDSNKNA